MVNIDDIAKTAFNAIFYGKPGERYLVSNLNIPLYQLHDRDFRFDKLKNDLNVTTSDPYASVIAALEWFKQQGLLK